MLLAAIESAIPKLSADSQRCCFVPQVEAAG